jgi:hypothetical protein
MADEKPGEGYGAKGTGPVAGAGLGEDDERVFRVWFEGLTLQDPRYNTKAIMILAREAMVDDDRRSRILRDPPAYLREVGAAAELPHDMTVRFLTNTPETLNVVLPPLAGSTAGWSPRLREALESRTSVRALGEDDWNISDPATDPIIFLPPPGDSADGTDTVIGFP